MIFLEKSELPSQNVLPKIILLPHLNKCQSPSKQEPQSPTPPPPIYIPITTLRMFFFLSNFLYLKITDKAQLCTGKIGIIPILVLILRTDRK